LCGGEFHQHFKFLRKGTVMISLRTKIFGICSIACFLSGITGCEKGVAGKQGQEIDNAVVFAEETTHEAAE